MLEPRLNELNSLRMSIKATRHPSLLVIEECYLHDWVPDVCLCFMDRYRAIVHMQIVVAGPSQFSVCTGQPNSHILDSNVSLGKGNREHFLFDHLARGWGIFVRLDVLCKLC